MPCEVCSRWLNDAALTSRDAGSLGYNAVNLTANHSGAPYRKHATFLARKESFKIAGLGKSRTRRIPCRRLHCPPTPGPACYSSFPVAVKTPNPDWPPVRSIHFHHFMLIVAPLPEIAEITLLWSITPTNK